jgi:alpha-galactosidase
MLEVGNGAMSNTEYVSHFSLWCIMAAPLIAGNDLRSMEQPAHDILTNAEAIAVDQDAAGIQGSRVRDEGDFEVWMKPLGAENGGEKAVVLFNRSADTATIKVDWREIGISGAATVRDLWAHKDLGTFTGAFSAGVESHGVVMVRIKAKG